MKEEITGVLSEIRWPPNCETFFFGRITRIIDGQPAESVKICGTADQDELKPHLTYRWYGTWKDDPKWGRQFKVDTFTPAKPHGRTGIVKYLQQAPHIGEATAIQFWNKWASDSVRIAREHPDIVAAEISRLNQSQCEEIAEKLKDLSHLEDTNIELIDLLSGRGFPKQTARLAVKRWGNKAKWVIERNPYKLQAFRGIGWLKCDSFWVDLGLPPNKMKRQYHCIWYSVASDRDGNTWLPDTTARQFLKTKIAGVEVDFEKALKIAKRAGLIAEKRWCDKCRGSGVERIPDFFEGETTVEVSCSSCGGTGGERWIAEGKKASSEFYVANEIARASIEPGQWPSIPPAPDGKKGITEHQAEGIAQATKGKIGLLLGSPGTGKTFSAAAIIKEIIRVHGLASVAIAAPTGKASVRCTESLANYGIPLRATTIHTLLGVDTADPETGNWGFKRNENNPLPFQFIIIDESSMLDVPLIRSLLAARGSAHVLFIGDPNQLPPVGHGAPLRDFIAAGVPFGMLTEIKRNAGTIVRACAAIRDGKPIPIDSEIVLDKPCPTCGGSGDENFGASPPWGAEAEVKKCTKCNGSGNDPDFSPQNLRLVTAGKAQAPQAIEKIVCELRDSGVDPVWGVQVIVAVNKRSPLARHPLNARLQELLNPGGQTAEGSPFRVNDKVICLKNSMFKLDQDGEDASVPVANGEFGKVYRVEKNRTFVEFFSPNRKVVIGRAAVKKGKEEGENEESGSGCDLDLGYAATCHKCQGSDCDHIIVALDEYPGATGPFGVCSREWAFTAISRAKIACHLVGLRQTLRTQCANQSLNKRKTFLAETIVDLRKSYLLLKSTAEKSTTPPAPPAPPNFDGDIHADSAFALI